MKPRFSSLAVWSCAALGLLLGFACGGRLGSNPKLELDAGTEDAGDASPVGETSTVVDSGDSSCGLRQQFRFGLETQVSVVSPSAQLAYVAYDTYYQPCNRPYHAYLTSFELAQPQVQTATLCFVAGSDVTRWASHSVAYGSAAKEVWLTALGVGSVRRVLVMRVSAADRRWTQSVAQEWGGSPWGAYPPFGVPDVEPGPKVFASTTTGTMLSVAGSRADGSGLSVTFTEGPPDGNTVTLHPTAFIDPSVTAFYAVAENPAGGVYAAGVTAGGAVRVAKLTVANTLDTSFGAGGHAALPLVAGDVAHGAGIAVDRAGRIVVTHSLAATGATRVARLLATGAPDPSFAPVDTTLLNPEGEHLDLGIDLDGEILVPGLVPAADGPPMQGGYVRIHPNGVRDLTYGPNGIVRGAPPAGPERPRPERVRFSLSPDARSCQGTAFMFVGAAKGQPSTAYAFIP